MTPDPLNQLVAQLAKLPGIGEKTAKKLLAQYGSVNALKSLSIEELSQVVKPTQARKIHEFLSAS